LLWSEQGYGDTIQFCRYAGMVSERGGRVILQCQKPLITVMRRVNGVDQIFSDGEPVPHYDYHSPLLSLPRIFGTRLDSIPGQTKYLTVDIQRIEKWQARLGVKAKSRIGLAWSGSATHADDIRRSVSLSTLLNYLPSTYEYISLQKEVRESDRSSLTKSLIKHFGDELIDFDDTAAICELCDQVISVDTSVAHLSAALGKKTIILLPFVPDWRWMLGRDDSPWYPSVRLIRQGRDLDWNSSLSAAVECLGGDPSMRWEPLD
jgi:hypothetical protein